MDGFTSKCISSYIRSQHFMVFVKTYELECNKLDAIRNLNISNKIGTSGTDWRKIMKQKKFTSTFDCYKTLWIWNGKNVVNKCHFVTLFAFSIFCVRWWSAAFWLQNCSCNMIPLLFRLYPNPKAGISYAPIRVVSGCMCNGNNNYNWHSPTNSNFLKS